MNNRIASQKKQTMGTLEDWHRADIVAALRKRGMSLAQLSRDHGLASRTLNNAFERHYPKAESLIAQALEMSPEQLWPSRYSGKTLSKLLPGDRDK
ncbi:helix-turn-helix domain-containing protein [Scandinavium manionii]|uniref:helix-turn-helix domain-containing protein n=1 Tax=Scandinavium manionii TaxID=2926520 RepID=UPI001305CC8B|nr:helix-turn-helix transcriptional regulator [Scandinavium manionii]MCS2147111.1 helix-turn-helix domain-containing protein [Scandinavium manionii]MRS14098.1 transcriptional regulator [Enterobacteriaceae bacterium RIT691]